MPTNYGDDLCLESYIDCLCQLQALITESDGIHILIAGDFNCGPGSKFFSEFCSFANENNLVTSDLSRLRDVATYISDDRTKMSWIDHILSSVVIDKLIAYLTIFNYVIVSDHKPVSFTICSVNTRGKRDSILLNNSTGYRVPLWNNCASTTLACYALHVDELLQSIAIPYDAVFDNSCDKSYLLDIDRFYNEIC